MLSSRQNTFILGYALITCSVLDAAEELKASKKWKNLVNAVNKNDYPALLETCITVVKQHGLY